MGPPMKNDTKSTVEVIDPPLSRVTLRPGIDGFKLDEAVVARAELLIQSMGNDYMNWVADEIRALGVLYAQALAATSGRDAVVQEIALIAHDLRGSGTSFGYDLITAIGMSLSEFCRSLDECGPFGLNGFVIQEALQVVS